MKRILLLLICCCILSGCVSAVMTGANVIYNHNTIEHTVSDYYISLQIKHDLNAVPELNKADISVTSFNCVVLLTGEVPTEYSRQHAGKIASRIKGVKRVFNGLSVEKPLTTAQAAKDTWLTGVVRAKLIASNDIDPKQIKVITNNSTVYLLGIVPRQQADIATTLAQNTWGVKAVVPVFYYIIMPDLD